MEHRQIKTNIDFNEALRCDLIQYLALLGLFDILLVKILYLLTLDLAQALLIVPTSSQSVIDFSQSTVFRGFTFRYGRWLFCWPSWWEYQIVELTRTTAELSLL